MVPIDGKILEFSNRWYEGALKNSRDVELSSGMTIRAITPPYFLGTKMEAFLGRGQNDYMASHDSEDFLAVIDGRNSIVEEVRLRMLICERSLGERCHCFWTIKVPDAIPGYLLPDAANQARLTMIFERLNLLASPSQ
jgi:hypothetical protein